MSQVPLVSAYSLAGKDEGARAAAKEVLRIRPKFSVERWSRILPFKDSSVTESVAQALRKAVLPD